MDSTKTLKNLLAAMSGIDTCIDKLKVDMLTLTEAMHAAKSSIAKK